MTTLLGNVIDDRYELLVQIGSGGMGTVYKANQHPFEREVALKMLAGDMPEQDSESRARFEREALAISKLKHKNIVMFYGYGVYRGAPYMVMEYIHGHSLQESLRSNTPLDPQYTMRVVEQITEALCCAHANGLVHRDLKPSNVMIVDDHDALTVKIIDFGLARLLPSFGTELQKLTEAGSAIGSVLYMSPEQCTGLPTDARSDIYALGCIMHHCLTGFPPFNGDHSVVVMQQHVSQPMPRMNSAVPEVSPNLQAIVDRATAKDPADRYQTSDEMLSDVRAFLAGRDIAAETKATVQHAPQPHISNDGVSVVKQTNRSKIRRLSIAAAIATMSVAGYFFGDHIAGNRNDEPHTFSLWTLDREADEALRNGKFEDAARLYKKVVDLNDEHRLLNFEEGDIAASNLSNCYVRLGRFDGVRKLVKEQIRRYGRRNLHLGSGQLLVSRYLMACDLLHDSPDSINFLRSIMARMRADKQPGWGRYAQLAIVRLKETRRDDEAIALADQTLPELTDPAEKAVVLVAKGMALHVARRKAESKQTLEEAVRLATDSDVTNSVVLHAVGHAYMLLGRYEEARQTLEDAATDHDAATSVRPTLAQCYALMSKFPEARQALVETMEDSTMQDSISAGFTRTTVAGACRSILPRIPLTNPEHEQFEKLMAIASQEPDKK